MQGSQAQTIYKSSKYLWKGNQFTEGQFKAYASSATDLHSNYESEWNTSAPNYMPKIDPGIDRKHWTLKRDITHLPHYTSTFTIDNYKSEE